MLAAGEFEVLGAWPSSGRAFEQTAVHLAQRGVERIQLICIDGTVDQATPGVGIARVDGGFASSSLQVGDLVPAMSIAMQFVGGRRRALLSAVAVAGRLHGRLVRAIGRRAPFTTEEAAATFIAHWLERVDRSLDDLAPSARRMGMPAKALPSPSAIRATSH
jgi:hypothetical protein